MLQIDDQTYDIFMNVDDLLRFAFDTYTSFGWSGRDLPVCISSDEEHGTIEMEAITLYQTHDAKPFPCLHLRSVPVKEDEHEIQD